jgi:hypothetical protein
MATMIGSARHVTAPTASTPLNTVVVTTAAITPAQALPVHQLTVTAENAPHSSWPSRAMLNSPARPQRAPPSAA